MADDVRTPGGDQPRISRRRLMSGSTVAAAGLAAGNAVQAAAGEPAPPADPRRVVYEETDHMRFFYRRARM